MTRLDTLINELEDYENTERVVMRELSRHYLAVIIGRVEDVAGRIEEINMALILACWAVLTAVQGLSLLCLYFWEFAPIVIGMILSAICILFYYSYIWKVSLGRNGIPWQSECCG